MLFGHRVNTLKHIFKNAKKISKLFRITSYNVCYTKLLRRRNYMKTRIILVGGFLGAGKTTLLWNMAKKIV